MKNKLTKRGEKNYEKHKAFYKQTLVDRLKRKSYNELVILFEQAYQTNANEWKIYKEGKLIKQSCLFDERFINSIEDLSASISQKKSHIVFEDIFTQVSAEKFYRGYIQLSSDVEYFIHQQNKFDDDALLTVIYFIYYEDCMIAAYKVVSQDKSKPVKYDYMPYSFRPMHPGSPKVIKSKITKSAIINELLSKLPTAELKDNDPASLNDLIKKSPLSVRHYIK